MRTIVFAFAVLLLLSGCAASYSCGTPVGISCRSLSDVYEAREAGNLPHQRGQVDIASETSQSDTGAAEPASVPVRPQIISVEPGNPLLSRPNVLRVWINRYESDGDLHDEQFVYLRLDEGRWLLTGE